MDFLFGLLYQHGLLAMFLVILLEYACFPISSEIVLPFSGAVASIQNHSFPLVLLLSVFAGLLGTSFCYIIGYFGGNKLLDSIIHRFPDSEYSIQNSKEKFISYGTYAVGICRVIPICRTYIAFIAGISKQNLITFYLSSFVGITIWNTLLIGCGYLLRENWELVISYYKEYKIVLIPLVILLVLLFVWKKRKSK